MEMIRHLNETEIAGELALTADPRAEIIETLGAGFWSVRQTQAFCDDWVKTVRSIHAEGRPVVAIANMVHRQVQTPEVAAILAKSIVDLFNGRDSIAVLVPSSLAKMQMRRGLGDQFHGLFVSLDAARLWLSSRGFATAERYRPRTLAA